MEQRMRRWGSLVLGWTAAVWWALAVAFPAGSPNRQMDTALRLSAQDTRWSMIGLAALGFVWLRGGRWSAVGWAVLGAGGWLVVDGWAERSGASGPFAAVGLAGLVGTAVWARSGAATAPTRPAVLIWCALLAGCLSTAGSGNIAIVEIGNDAPPDISQPLGPLALLPVNLVLGLGLGLGALVTAARRPVRPRTAVLAAVAVAASVVAGRWLPQPAWPGWLAYLVLLWIHAGLVALCVVATVLVGPPRHPATRLVTTVVLAVVVPQLANVVMTVFILTFTVSWLPTWRYELLWRNDVHPVVLSLIGGSLLAWLFTGTGPVSRWLTGQPAPAAVPHGDDPAPPPDPTDPPPDRDAP